MHKFINQLKTQNPDLKYSEIEGILQIILENQKNLTNNDLVSLTGLPKETVRQFKVSISPYLQTPDGDGIELNESGKKLIEEINPKPFAWTLFTYSEDRTHKLEDDLNKILTQHNLRPKRDYDQFFARLKTSVSKALIIMDTYGCENKNIALIGDDDMVSICLALMKAPFSRLTVLDIDEDLLTAIETILNELNIKNFQTIKYDCRDGLKPELLGRFDLVITDPPYTSSGIETFINRAIQLLGITKGYEGKYIYLYHGTSFKTPEKTLKVQQIVNHFNLVEENVMNKFAHYTGAESIGNSSTLYVLKTTESTQPIPDVELSKYIYTYHNPKEERFPYVSHYSFKIMGINEILLKSKPKMLNNLNAFCRLHKFKVVDSKITEFSKKGLTFTLILSSSNLLAHTWPEYGALHLDLIVCSPIYNADSMSKNLLNIFKADNIEVRRIE